MVPLPFTTLGQGVYDAERQQNVSVQVHVPSARCWRDT